MPNVSVIMPVFNGAPYIRQALDSVLGQSFAALEVIVVDDGSTDDTRCLLADFGDRITVLAQARKGPSAARNRGLEAARGEYVAFMDADDEWAPSFLSTTVRALAAQPPSVVGVCTGWLYVRHDGRPLVHTRQASSGVLSVRDLLTGGQFPIHAALTRREAVLRVGGFDEHIRAMEDWDLWLRLLADGDCFSTIPQHLASYRLHGPSNSGDPDRMRQGRMLAVDKLFGRLDLPPELRSLEQVARSAAHVESSAALYGAGRSEEGKREFVEAVRSWPHLLKTEEPYYALACATQPVGHKASSYPMDLQLAERRLVDALHAGLEALGSAGHRVRRRVHGRAYRVLARCGALQRSRGATVRYTYLAARHDFATGDILTCAKALLRGVAWRPSRWPPSSRPSPSRDTPVAAELVH
jgi:glycosyltransferase involved in cell wall biosynthesis